MTAYADATTAETRSRHTRVTRLIHMGLAITIILQLATSLVMSGPGETRPGDALFQLHRLSGFGAAFFALMFWLVILLRQRGTTIGALFPWLSGPRLRALREDVIVHVRSAMRFRLPEYEPGSPLASAVHGLGLMLMSAMAGSGLIYAIQVWAGKSAEPDGMWVMQIHFALANLVWVYLTAHAGLGLIHHHMRTMRLSEMWSFRG